MKPHQDTWKSKWSVFGLKVLAAFLGVVVFLVVFVLLGVIIPLVRPYVDCGDAVMLIFLPAFLIALLAGNALDNRWKKSGEAEPCTPPLPRDQQAGHSDVGR
jgi:uncharacterized membrane protein